MGVGPVTEEVQSVPKVARRTLIAAAAWSVPAVAVLSATPAFASSIGTVSISVTDFTVSQKSDNLPIPLDHWLSGNIKVKLTNTGGNVDPATISATVVFVRIKNALGTPVSSGEHSKVLTPITVAANGTATFNFVSNHNLALGTWRITYTVSAKTSDKPNVQPGPLSAALTQVITLLG